MATIGVAVGLLAWPVLGALTALGTLLALCWLVRQVLLDVVPGSRARATPNGGFLQSLTVAAAILAVCSYGWVSPPLGLFVILTAGLSSPALVRRALGSPRGPAPTAADHHSAAQTPAGSGPGPEEVGCAETQLTSPEAEGPLNGLDNRQLCRLWRDSFWLLCDTSSPEVMLCRVTLREACLNEMERRDADAVRAWLDSGARASSGPDRFLTDPPRRGPL